ncbi:ABC transporter permease [Saccharothrix deserti]|uniref:ABC transporter permease n=1 Tax=Saccharothrix deserti TaxID=2593674 RepID=UPI00131DEF3E|nr:ABC transporter permease [Saccharothrix deserti]
MTTTLEMPPRPAETTSTATPTTAHRQTLGRAIHSEWIKIRSLRSTWIGMATVVLVMIGLGSLSAAVSTGSVAAPGDGGGPLGGGGPLSTVLAGADFAVLLIGVLGSLAGAREYSSRMISATVAAVPRRWQVVAAKAIVLAAVVIPTALIGVMGAFGAGMGILSASDAATVALTDDGVLRSVLGMAGYVTAIALLGLGLGILLRSTAGSIGAVVGGIMVLPTVAGALLPDSWDTVLRFLPSSAASSFTTVMSAGDSTLSAGAGVAVLAAWVAAALGAAAFAITRRDV